MDNNTLCYKGDGDVSEDISCGPAILSTCCGAGWECLSNGLCRNPENETYSQGTCTEPGYVKCLSFCNARMCKSILNKSTRSDSMANVRVSASQPNTMDTPKSISATPLGIAGAARATQMTVIKRMIAATPT